MLEDKWRDRCWKCIWSVANAVSINQSNLRLSV